MFGLLSKLLASLMMNYSPKRPSGAPLHTSSILGHAQSKLNHQHKCYRSWTVATWMSIQWCSKTARKHTRVLQKVLLCTKYYIISNAYYIWFILINLGRHHDQNPSLINYEIIFLNTAELSTLMHVQDIGKFNFRGNFHII